MSLAILDPALTTTESADHWISAAPLLDEGECKRIREGLDALREHWVQRHPTRPFYTMGAANYFDITYNPLLPYYRMAARWNPILREQFGWFYDKLQAHLEQRLGAPVAYRDSLAMPGFHIFLFDQAFEEPADMTHREWFLSKGKKEVVGNAIHCDTAHLVVNWAGSKPDLEHPVSVTIPIDIPAAGAGLNYWGFGKERTADIPPTELRDFLMSQPREFFPYPKGQVVLHDGLRYHQMAAMRNMEPGEARITLQGHGVLIDGVWQLFW